MKDIRFVWLPIMICIATGCSTKSDHPTGFYIASWQNEYTRAWDTLEVKPITGTLSGYRIEKNTGYQKIRDGKLQPKAYSRKKWSAEFDDRTNQLSEGFGGRVLRLTPEGIYSSSTLYRKIR